MADRPATLVACCPVALLTLDPDGRVAFANPEACRLAGSALLGQSFAELFGHEFRAAAAAYLARLGVTDVGTSVHFEGEAVRPDGSRLWLEVNGTDLTADPAVAGPALALRDATEPHRQMEDLRRLAHVDSLTGLANRTLLHERLGAARRTSRPGALINLDLDQFQTVNDRDDAGALPPGLTRSNGRREPAAFYVIRRPGGRTTWHGQLGGSDLVGACANRPRSCPVRAPVAPCLPRWCEQRRQT